VEKKFYQIYYEQERKHWWFKVRANILINQIKKLGLKSNSKILNVGACTYKTSELLEAFGKVISVEFDEDCCAFVKQKLGKEMIQASATALPFADNSFDLICAFDVIEHIENDALAIQEIKRVTKENGFVFLSVPAYQFLWSYHDVVNHHFRRYTLKNLLSLVAPPKNKIIKKTYFNSILFAPILILRLLSKFKSNKVEAEKSNLEVFDNNKLINRIFYKLFSIEVSLLNKMNFPFGVSIMLLYRK